MKKILSVLLVFASQSAFAEPSTMSCLDVFAAELGAPIVAVPETPQAPLPPKPEVPKPPEVAAPKTADDIADALEIGPTRIEKFDFTIDELNNMYIMSAQLLGVPAIDSHVREAIFAAFRIYDAELKQKIDFLGQSLSVSVKSMRARRLQFKFLMGTNDPLKAAELYRDLWTSYYVSRSRLLEYTLADRGTRDEKLVDESFWILKSLTVTQKDLAKQVVKIYGKDGELRPRVTDVLSLYDQVYARNNDEFRYISWYINELAKTARGPMRDNLNYVVGRLSVDQISRVFGIELINQAYLDSEPANALLRNSRPQILAWGMKYARDQQAKYGKWLVLTSTLQNALTPLLAKIPYAPVRDGLLTVLMLNYNNYVMNVHGEAIQQVLLAPKSKQLSVFETNLGHGGTVESSVEFLETFARLSTDKRVWNEIKDDVSEAAKTHGNDAILLAQMNGAENAIAKYGWISRYNETSAFDTIVGLTTRGTPVAIAGITYYWPQISSWFHQLMILLTIAPN